MYSRWWWRETREDEGDDAAFLRLLYAAFVLVMYAASSFCLHLDAFNLTLVYMWKNYLVLLYVVYFYAQDGWCWQEWRCRSGGAGAAIGSERRHKI